MELKSVSFFSFYFLPSRFVLDKIHFSTLLIFFLVMEMYLKATFPLKCPESIKCHFVTGNFMLAQN